MFLLPRRLRESLKKEKGEEKRAFAADVDVLELANVKKGDSQDVASKPTDLREYDIFPKNPSVKEQWLSLSIREREIAALICRGYRNYEIAGILKLEYGTVRVLLHKACAKLNVHTRHELRAALISWPAEEWWKAHHY